MQIPKAWYTVASSSEVRERPVSIQLFSEDFVLWRDSSGQAIMQRDTCPHRSAKLSLGEVRENCIQCPFHGFKFDTTGSCILVPETEKPAPNLRVKTFKVVEQNGFVWFNNGIGVGGGDDDAGPPPWFDELDSGLLMHEKAHEWPTHITRCVENQLDYAHLPFVHRTTIGRNVDVRGQRQIECQNNRISMFVSQLDASKPAIQFIFPNLWLLTISSEKFYQFISFVPMSESRTKLYLRAYQRIIPIPILAPLLTPLFNKSNSIILEQDRHVVLSQRPSVSTTAAGEKLFPSDRAVEHFRRLWLEQVNS